MIRQTNKGKKYHHLKKIHQINIDNYDLFKKGKFIYHSYLMEETLHLKRDDLVEVIDINLDFLSEIMYTLKKLVKMDLRWLLYLFVCSDRKKRTISKKGCLSSRTKRWCQRKTTGND